MLTANTTELELTQVWLDSDPEHKRLRCTFPINKWAGSRDSPGRTAARLSRQRGRDAQSALAAKPDGPNPSGSVGGTPADGQTELYLRKETQ